MSAAESQNADRNIPESQFETDPAKGRDFHGIGVHPNGEELLFVECSRELDSTGDCYVLRYHLGTQRLQRYVLPAGYYYTTTSFSPQRNSVVMSRVPKHDQNEKSIQQAYDNSEIVVMNADGGDFKILPLAKGNKVAPIMSSDEARIAYWRATLREPGSKTFASNFDVWEVDLITGQDRLFAKPFSFFEGGRLQYLSNDMLLVDADGPRKYGLDMSSYWKKYNRSAVYRVRRGTTTLPEPILTEVEGSTQPSSDRAGNLYFYGQRPGISLFRKSPEGRIEQWVEPFDIATTSSLVAAPDGSYIAFIYKVKGTHPRDGKAGIGLLMTQTSEWKPINIPTLKISTPLAGATPH